MMPSRTNLLRFAALVAALPMPCAYAITSAACGGGALGEQVIEVAGRQVPFTFDVRYDPTVIQPSHTYAVQARIEVDGRLRFINDIQYAVLTRGAPNRVTMVLKMVGGSAGE